MVRVRALCELDLADDYGASRTQSRNHRGIRGRTPICQHRCAAAGRHTTRLQQILDGNRHAVQQPRWLAGLQCGVRCIGLCAR